MAKIQTVKSAAVTTPSGVNTQTFATPPTSSAGGSGSAAMSYGGSYGGGKGSGRQSGSFSFSR